MANMILWFENQYEVCKSQATLEPGHTQGFIYSDANSRNIGCRDLKFSQGSINLPTRMEEIKSVDS